MSLRKPRPYSNMLPDDWPKMLDAQVKKETGFEVETFYDLFGTGTYVTRPADGVTPLTDRVHAVIRKFMEDLNK